MKVAPLCTLAIAFTQEINGKVEIFTYWIKEFNSVGKGLYNVNNNLYSVQSTIGEKLSFWLFLKVGQLSLAVFFLFSKKHKI